MSAPTELQIWALPNLPTIQGGDPLAAITADALKRNGFTLQSHDVLVFAQKVISKAEGRLVDLTTVTPTAKATELATAVKKDPRIVELVLRESTRIVRTAPDVLIVQHRLGMIMANAGIDQSNVADPASGEFALLLPEDPDASAARLRDQLNKITGTAPGIVINDSFGRPWRMGTVGVAIGCAGLPAVQDLRGDKDLFGRPLRVTVVGHADEIASAASLLMGQGSEGRPIVLIRGLALRDPHTNARALIRPPGEDLFK
jgi:coenzyme F420-0:L-glutamate ligase / coenzyme F420-1:gamma-L-glutamate ligase